MSMEVNRKSVRIRLCFEEREMLSKAQVDQGLAKSWYLVNADVLDIGQLAVHINHDYRLRESCPKGLVLEMSGFALPPAQSTRILQDSDLVSVRRKQDGGSGGLSRELPTNILSVDNEEIDQTYRNRREGVLPLDEAISMLKKKAEAIRRELPELFLLEDSDADFSLGSGKNLKDGLNGRKKLSVKESSGKKRKRSLVPDTQMQIVSPISRKMPEGLDLEPLAVKKRKSSEKKKQKVRDGEHGSSRILALEGLPRSEHIEGSAKIEKKKKKIMGELVEQTGPDLNNGDRAAAKEMNAREAKQSKGREVKGSDGSFLNNKSKTGHIDLVEKKQPSRSARRKKAKKRWLREHAQLQNGGIPKKDDAKPQQTEKLDTSESETSEEDAEAEEVLQNVVVPKKVDAKSQQTQKMDTSESETSEENAEAEEVEAEEEILPMMVAPGHIRFERDEDAAEEGRCAPTVVVSYPNVRCKQQGQAWGQEKSQGRYSEGHYRRCDKMDDRPSHVTTKQLPNAKFVAEKIDFERLPLLNRAPWVGDLLAYRLVELTASWTPELSCYRVGKVSSHDATTKMISVIPVPEYPIHGDEDGQADEDLFLPPYNPDGTLEVSLSTLMEVRVLEEGPQGRPSAVEAKIATQEDVGMNGTTVGVPSEPLQPSTLSSKVPEENVECGVRMNLNAASVAVSSQSNAEELRSGRDNEAEGGPFMTEAEPVLDGPSDAGWEDMLSEEINKKKLELASRAGNGPEGQDCGNDENQAHAGGVKQNLSKDGSVENGKRVLGTNGAPIIRHRYMRSGALGPTMALLRASQVL